MLKNPLDTMTTIEKIVIMQMIWDSLSDEQQATWLQDNMLEYQSPDTIP